MPDKKRISWQLNVNIDRGPSFVIPSFVEIEAFEVVEVRIPKQTTATGTAFEIQPGQAVSVKMLLISLIDSANYQRGISYAINTDQTDPARRVKLDQAHFFAGAGAIGMLGADPKQFFFYNPHDQDAIAQVVVGRLAAVVP
jgi:hypothetical protein